jgi:UV DNA damage endonuclease
MSMNNSTVRLGYCCINLSLADQRITANRGMIKRTFTARGPAYCGELAHQNIKDILKILRWNVKNGIFVYRMSSDVFPWMSEYEIQKLPNFKQIQVDMQKIGEYAMDNGIRLSMHPGQFDVLCSPSEAVVRKTIKDINQHSEIMDLMGLPQSHQFPINIHLGGTYGDKESAAQRFCENFTKLTPSAQSRLVVENDDKAAQYSVIDLYRMVYMRVGTPITFDFHHHRFNDGGLTEEEALTLASRTWKESTQLTHYSSCKKTFEDPSVIARSHADYVYERINDYGLTFDCEVEAKAKDLAVIKYRKQSIGSELLENYLSFDDKRYFEKIES